MSKTKLKEVIANLEIARFEATKKEKETWQYYDELKEAILKFLDFPDYMPHFEICYCLKNGKVLKFEMPSDSMGHIMIVEKEVQND